MIELSSDDDLSMRTVAAHATPERVQPDHPAFRSSELTDEELRFFKAEG
jgi:hypothetical protein